jgi:mRNA-degrading endonuclease RelE of RelBE toxin-antitoxin system
MSYKVKTLTVFERQAKRLIKKYASLKEEIFELVQQLKENPKTGTGIGRNCFKIRLAVASKGKGKSGGIRIITYFLVADKTIYLISIYDKSKQENFIEQELDELLHDVCIQPI